ncbi:MAG: M28 family peptidase [Candidatus Helarchaeota archaeon]
MNLNDINGSQLYETMLELIKIGWRRVGTEQSKKADNYILKKFIEFGLEDSKLEPFEMLLYNAKKWKLTLKCGSLSNNEIIIDCHPLWHTKSSEIGGTESELIHIGFGTSKEFNKSDIKGKIVVVDSFRMMSFYPTMDFWRVYELSKKHGAVGLIVIHDSPPNTLFVEYATRHETLKNSNLESGNMPALVINYESGLYLKSLMKYETNIIANLLLESEIKPVLTENIIGVLPGKKTDEIILIGTHTDSWFDGAIDNAGANAGLIELANYYSQIPIHDRNKTMIFVGFAGHEVGSIGAIEFAKKHSDIFNKITTFCMLDGFGSKGYILESPSRCVIETGLDEAKGLFTTENSVLFEFIKDAVFKYKLFPSMHVSAISGPFSDLGPFVANKIPSMMIIGKGIFYHTIEDTADKVLPDQLERTTKAHIEILNNIHNTPSSKIKDADRKSIPHPITSTPSNRGNVYFNFNITPNPMFKGTTALIYLTSYRCIDRIIIDFKWSINNKDVHSPILPQRFGKTGKHPVKLTLTDNFGNEYSKTKYAYVINKHNS